MIMHNILNLNVENVHLASVNEIILNEIEKYENILIFRIILYLLNY